MADVLDRIRKLIALAASSNENEARNASFLAAKLIREHNVQLSLERPRTSSFEDLFSRPTPRPSRRPEPDGGYKAPKRTPQPDETRTDKYGLLWGFYKYSPFEGNCTYCGKWLFRGDTLLRRQDDLRHHRCWDLANAPPKSEKKPEESGVTVEELDELFKNF